MPGLESGLPAEQRLILAIDTSDDMEASRLADMAYFAGAWVVKMGLEISSATSWDNCSGIAYQHDISWVADAKLDDIPNTTAGAVRNLAKLDPPPVGITIHTNSGVESMKAAQEIAGEFGITMLAVTHLTSVEDSETKDTYGFVRNTLVKRRAQKAVEAGIEGVVCSPREIKKVIKKHDVTSGLVTMIPGTRSVGADAQDQKNVKTPYQAIVDGADLLVIGRQVTKAKDPEQEYEKLVQEVQAGLDARREA